MKPQRSLKLILSASLIGISLLFSPTILASPSYSVTGVVQWDVLSMRKYPGIKSKIIAQIPPNGSAINTTGKSVKKGQSTWVQVKWKTQTGWVNKRYLTLSANSNDSGASANKNAHTHPKNKCTNSITHTHPNGAKSHVHRYSCQGNQEANNEDSHQHPANRCTRSVTHNHPNGKRTHEHRYSCQGNTTTTDANAHTHPKQKCTNSVTHSHPNGKNDHEHKYSCKQ